MIKDVGVFAVTATFSIFAYLWLYFIVAISGSDEVSIAEGSLTFIFFPVLVALAFAADKGYFSLGSLTDDDHNAPPKCEKSHEMEFLGVTQDSDGWGCDGRFQPGGCRSGITGYHQTKGVDRYRCQRCDYDLCKKCVESNRKATTSHIIGSDVSKEEIAAIEHKILQQHGDALSDEQLARLIQKEHAEPMTRAAYRVAAVRSMVGGKRVADVKSDDNSQYSLTSIVPVDGSTNGDAKRPVVCPKGHNMHSFVTNKANFNCDMCQKRFPMGTVLYGCRACNFDACAECKVTYVKADVIMQFCSASYAVLESIGTLVTQVHRSGDLSQRVTVEYKTRDGSAKAGEDYVAIEGKLEFEPGETQKPLGVQIVDDTSYEEDEEFFIDLTNPTCNVSGCKAIVGANKTATVSIVDDDLPGVLFFEKEQIEVTEGIDNKVVTATVKRKDGSNGTISCKFATEDGTALAGRDYLSVQGTLVFEPGQMSRDVQLTVLSGHHYESTEEFRLNLTFEGLSPEQIGGATFDATTDGGAEACVCTVIILSDEAARSRTDRVMKVLMMDWDKAQIGHANWKDQFIDAVLVNGGEDGDASILDWTMHIITVFWKVLFAIIPPTDFCDGWLCFVSSLLMIGVVTAFIGDMAGLLGCTLNIPDKITAITFVALGTSLPDTFASKTAAEQDPYADASVGNVTGSNSVNVFLGLGLPWVMGSVYWKVMGKTDRWREEYASYPDLLKGDEGIFVVIGGDLGFSVGVFSGCAIVAIAGLLVRRKLFGGELGGPDGAKKVTAVLLVTLWFIYIGMSSWMIMKNKKDC